jgi:hypothetical protein
MLDRKITHEVKLQKSVIIILGVLAVGVMANAFAPAFSIKDALAQSGSLDNLGGTITINCIM